MAKVFEEPKDNTSEVSKHLKSLKIDDMVEIVNTFGKPHGDAGVEYIRGRVIADMKKNESQLKVDRDQLNKEGYKIGIKQDRGYKILAFHPVVTVFLPFFNLTPYS